MTRCPTLTLMPIKIHGIECDLVDEAKNQMMRAIQNNTISMGPDIQSHGH
jgi:hypothetical protein